MGEKLYRRWSSSEKPTVPVTWKSRVTHAIVRLFEATIIAVILLVIVFQFVKTPRERELEREVEGLRAIYQEMTGKVESISGEVATLHETDTSIYRALFGMDPPEFTRRNRTEGDYQRRFAGFENREIMVILASHIDDLFDQVELQKLSYPEIEDAVLCRMEFLACVPSIQPVKNKSLRRLASGFGMRIHPKYKTKKMHTGIDFSCPRGEPVICTGNGVVSFTGDMNGYGNLVIVEHGWGYRTWYAHLDEIFVRVGDVVTRGDILAGVGNTGTTTEFVLHYEVQLHGVKVDPVNYFYNDLTPEQYDIILELASRENQSFD